MNREVLDYVPAGTQQFGYGIDPARRLTPKQQSKVLTRLRHWAAGRIPDTTPEPSLMELRWSDDLTHLYLQKTSGLLSWGFCTMFAGHGPIRDGENFAIYDHHNPAAHVLLSAIEEVTQT